MVGRQLKKTSPFVYIHTIIPFLRYKKGSHPKGRNVFLKDAEPFIKWLEEAEEEEGDA